MDPNQNVRRQSRGGLETDAAGLIRAAKAAADSNLAALKLPQKPLSGLFISCGRFTDLLTARRSC